MFRPKVSLRILTHPVAAARPRGNTSRLIRTFSSSDLRFAQDGGATTFASPSPGAEASNTLSVLLQAYHSTLKFSKDKSTAAASPRPKLNLYRTLTSSELHALWSGLSDDPAGGSGGRWWEISLGQITPAGEDTNANVDVGTGNAGGSGKGKALQTVYGFEDWTKAMVFWNKAAEVIGLHDHHPTITIHPNPSLRIVQLSITTHTHTPRSYLPARTSTVVHDERARGGLGLGTDEADRPHTPPESPQPPTPPPPGLTRKDFLLAHELDAVYDAMYPSVELEEERVRQAG